jgi:uncharacterized FlgJ-related protein
MFKELCATLFVLCNPLLNGFDFNYNMNPRDHFVQGVAQAILESDWGRSRFAKQGNNFYGIIETDDTEPHMKSLNSDVMLKVYGNKCESVEDYIDLLNTSSAFEEYRDLRMKQYMIDNVNVFDIIQTLENYAVDPEYTKKLLAVTLGLFEKYPQIFKSQEILKYHNNNKAT